MTIDGAQVIQHQPRQHLGGGLADGNGLKVIELVRGRSPSGQRALTNRTAQATDRRRTNANTRMKFTKAEAGVAAPLGSNVAEVNHVRFHEGDHLMGAVTNVGPAVTESGKEDVT